MDEYRFHRQELLFGKEGQDRLQKCRVAIIGLGGLGSHVAQQLAYLGVESFLLIDKDRASDSNLNRLIGATENDARLEALKVDIAERMIKTILPHANILKIPTSFISEEALARLQNVEFVFGCVDNDASRLVLNEFCQAYGQRYIDIATDIDPEDKRFGGRMLFADGRVCVSCKRLLNDEAVRARFSSERQRQEDDRIYGIHRGALGQTGPAVVSLNGILASVAVTEFMVEVTGVRPAHLYLEYKGTMGLIRDQEMPDFDCYYCKSLRGIGVKADVERYIREGWGERL